MHYDISTINDTAVITLEGNLNALDLLFMFQSQEYKNIITQYRKILIDYCNISGVALTAQDAMSITMLSKIDLENLGEINIVVAVNNNERNVMEKVTKSIFSDSQSNVSITNSRANAMQVLSNL